MSLTKKLITIAVITLLIILCAYPLILNNLKTSIFKENMDKNREQAERIAAMISMDLEKGEKAELVLESFQKILEKTQQSEESSVYILEHENKVIAHPDASKIGLDVTGWVVKSQYTGKTYTQAAGEGVEFGGIMTTDRRVNYMSYQVPIKTKPWAVAVNTKLKLVDLKAKTVLHKNLFIVTMAVVVSQLLFMFLYSAAVDSRSESRETSS